MLNHYQNLNVSVSADLAVIKKAYHKLSLLHHPDKTIHLPESARAQSENLFKLANVAFEVLSDPHMRQLYDQDLSKKQNSTTISRSNEFQDPPDDAFYYDHRTHSPPRRGRAASPPPPPPHSPTARRRQGHKGLYHAQLSTHRFSMSTLGVPPDFHWYHCELNERSDYTTLTYSNWLGWRFAIDVATHFKVVGKPILPEKPILESVVIRLPLRRKSDSTVCPLTDVTINVRDTPGSKQTVLSSALIESTDALELLVGISITSDASQEKVAQSASWRWAYSIDHGPLRPDLVIKVTNLMFYSSKPYMALSPTGGMPKMPYPDRSPMWGLVNQFPGIQIERLAPESYCRKEEQQGRTVWRLVAFGFK
ncbi:hypothetical protein OPT61_g1149 [Boeremia exigua]|uniref:Uncharacterized protein n=1 Tax=Boeremia exigua TaxID=749465 RepID=A0ACC2IRN9_9PLEO|nr:hypothetical protein OPT61_g1149 [Boeremia exigua]